MNTENSHDLLKVKKLSLQIQTKIIQMKEVAKKTTVIYNKNASIAIATTAFEATTTETRLT